MRIRSTFVLALGVLLAPPVESQPPPAREHTVVQSTGQLELRSAKKNVRGEPAVTIEVEGDSRIIRANGLPEHEVGRFPNRSNPNRIKAQSYVFKVPARPKFARQPTPLGLQDFGIAVNGVPFDPGAAEWYRGQRGSEWQYEALSGAIELGLDAHHAHVQPTGAYHYHGIPGALLAELGDGNGHSPLIGWAADGFPIYALRGYADRNDERSGTRVLKSSYRLKSGERPGGSDQPGGTYDGTFVADYEFVEGSGNLDACNGRIGRTPDFPKGTYAYFLTEDWPVIPRCFRGTPSSDFERRRPGGRR